MVSAQQQPQIWFAAGSPCPSTWALLQHKVVQAAEAGALEHDSLCTAVLELLSALMCARVFASQHTIILVGLLSGRQGSRVPSAVLLACVSPGLFLVGATPGRLTDGMLGMPTCLYVCWGELGARRGASRLAHLSPSCAGLPPSFVHLQSTSRQTFWVGNSRGVNTDISGCLGFAVTGCHPCGGRTSLQHSHLVAVCMLNAICGLFMHLGARHW